MTGTKAFVLLAFIKLFVYFGAAITAQENWKAKYKGILITPF